MNKTIMNRRYMADGVLTFLQTKAEVFKDDPEFQSLQLEMEQRVQELHSMQTDLEILRMPLSERKAQIKRTYVLRLDRLSKLIRQYAIRNQLDQIEQFLTSFKTRLSRGNVMVSLSTAQELVEIANTYKTDLETFSRGKLTVEQAEEALEDYSKIALRPGQRAKDASNMYDHFKIKLKQCIKFIRLDLFTFFTSWQEEYPQEYELFLSYADTPDFGRRYEEVEEESPPVDDFYSDDEMEV